MQICNPILPNRYAFNIVYRFGKIGNILHIPLIVSIKKIPEQYFELPGNFYVEIWDGIT